MLILACALTAHADAAIADTGGMTDTCQGTPFPVATVPAAGAIDVPVDVRPTVVFAMQCGGSPQWTLQVVDVDGNVLAGADVDAATMTSDVVTLIPIDALPADTDLVLRATPSGGYYTYYNQEIPFHTGSGAAVALEGEPTVAVQHATWMERSGIVSFTADIAVPRPVDGLTLAWIDTAFGSVTVLDGAGSFPGMHADIGPTGQPTGDVCLDVHQVDGLGNVATGEDCIEPELQLLPDEQQVERGCFGGRKAQGAIGLVGGLGLLARRRRYNPAT
jgi:hypothetical protein